MCSTACEERHTLEMNHSKDNTQYTRYTRDHPIKGTDIIRLSRRSRRGPFPPPPSEYWVWRTFLCLPLMSLDPRSSTTEPGPWRWPQCLCCLWSRWRPACVWWQHVMTLPDWRGPPSEVGWWPCLSWFQSVTSQHLDLHNNLGLYLYFCCGCQWRPKPV